VTRLPLVLALVVLLLLPPLAAPASAVEDYPVPGGRYFPQAGGFTIADEAGVPLWSEFQRLGGVAVLGYPISGRFERDGFVHQAVQRAILQWRPEQRRVVLTNVLDDLSRAGHDDWLLQARQTPRPLGAEADAGQPFPEVVRRRQALLDADEAIKRRYFASPDPLTFFGLPTSPVQDMGNHLAVRLQRGVIQKWKVDLPWARAGEVTLANAGDLAKEAGLLAQSALTSSSPAVEGRSERVPWSGWWWPADEAVRGPKLYDRDGPLARYDLLARARGLGHRSLREWEFANVRLTGGRFLWAGHCNGWAAAAILEPEPRAPSTVDGVTFSVADQKGLLASWHFADRVAWSYGDDERGVAAPDFHRQLLRWIGDQKKPFVVSAFAGSQQIDNYPAYRYRVVYRPDEKDPARTHVRATLWLVDYQVDPNFVGVKHWPSDEGKLYEYFVVGDRANPSGGDWEGVSANGASYARPWRIWYPDPTSRDQTRPLTSPDLDYAAIRSIVEGKPYLPPPRRMP
jgi:hypothetical protein